MSYTHKARTVGYSNLALAKPVGIERTIAGAAPPVFTAKWGNKENVAIGLVYGADENLVKVGVNLLAGERAAVPPNASGMMLLRAKPAADEDDADEDDPETASRAPKKRKAKA